MKIIIALIVLSFASLPVPAFGTTADEKALMKKVKKLNKAPYRTRRNCKLSKKAVEYIIRVARERLIAAGISDGGKTIMKMYVSLSGTYTITKYYPNTKVMCMEDTGNSFMMMGMLEDRYTRLSKQLRKNFSQVN